MLISYLNPKPPSSIASVMFIDIDLLFIFKYVILKYLDITLKNTQDDETRTKYNFIKLIEDNQRIIKYVYLSNFFQFITLRY